MMRAAACVAGLALLAALAPGLATGEPTCVEPRWNEACTVEADPDSPLDASYAAGSYPPPRFCRNPDAEEGAPCPPYLSFSFCIPTRAEPYAWARGGVDIPRADSGVYYEWACMGGSIEPNPECCYVDTWEEGGPVSWAGIRDHDADGSGDHVFVLGTTLP